MKIVRVFLAAIIIASLSGCSTMPPGQAGSNSSESGYFLSLKQKGQLIGTGRIQDAQGIWYDVWIVPGYVQPARRAKTYFQRAGSDFAEYVHAQKYRDLTADSRGVLKLAYDNCLTDFTIKGLYRAWKRYWSGADRRVSKRVMGWWFAYPCALLESAVDTVVRIPVGLAGTALGTVCGVVIIPGYYVVDSSLKGSWHFAVDSVALPVIAGTWNTVIAPPLAIVGQKPAPSRVDGFWVKQLSSDGVQVEIMYEVPINPKDVEMLAQLGYLLLTTSRPYEDRSRALADQTRREQNAIKEKSQQSEAVIRTEERESIQSLLSDPSQQGTIDYLRSRGFDYKRISKAWNDVSQYMKNQKKLSTEEIDRALNLLYNYRASMVTKQIPFPAKTDPVEHSIQVIKDVQEDMQINK